MDKTNTDKDWDNLPELVERLLNESKKLGADAAEVGVSQDIGLSASVRLGVVDTVEFNRGKSFGITVYKNKRKGSVSSTDIHWSSLVASLEAACKIAEYTEEDPSAGLADPDCLAKTIPDLDLYHPANISAEQAVALAKDCEAAALNFDPRITNSEGATFSTNTHYRVYGNTEGFLGAYPSTRYSLSCVVIAKEQDAMQRDYDFSAARDSKDLLSGLEIGQRAADKALKRLNARKIKTCQAPIIFVADIAGSLISHFIAAISGGNLYRRTSFLNDYLGKSIFPEFIQIQEMPHLLKGLGSAPFDQEGVATQRHDIIQAGILKSYVLGSYSARRLGLKTTGNAGGVHNLKISNSDKDLNGLLREMNSGLLVTELIGHGVNIVTGDYSRGAAGFWVENGQIQYPVHEITIAGNLKELFSGIVAVGNDIERRGTIFTGSILLPRMTIAGG